MIVLKSEELKVCLKSALSHLDDKREAVNRLNVFPVPDGDTGTNMVLTVKSAVDMALKVQKDDVGEILKSLSKGALMGARGNSGVILSQIFRGFSEGLDGQAEADVKKLAKGFLEASKKAYKAVMKPTEGTILTVSKDMANNAERIASHSQDIESFFRELLLVAKESLDKTPEKLPILKEAGVVDSGGAGLLVFWEGFYYGLSEDRKKFFSEEKSIEEVPEEDKPYSVAFSLDAEESAIRKLISPIVGGVEILKQNPLRVGFSCIDLGEVFGVLKSYSLFDISIKTLKDMGTIEVLEEKKNLTEGTAMISVSSGSGVSNLFKDLGVESVIFGGQTMNPSTEDFLRAIDEVPFTKILILPNNKNIILAANQAAELSDREVSVIPTKTIPQGMAAALAFNPEAELSDNFDNMTEASNNIKSGQVTYSVRDISINGLDIKKDDIMALSDGDIVANGNDLNSVSLELLEKMLGESSYLVTIIYGEEVSEETAAELKERFLSVHPEFEVEVINGNQPVYYYIISVE